MMITGVKVFGKKAARRVLTRKGNLKYAGARACQLLRF